MHCRPTTVSGLILASIILVCTPAMANEVAVSLRGSPNSMVRQNSVAKTLGYEFVKTADDLSALVEEGEFVELPGNEHYVVLKSVSYPLARPEIRIFIERLAAQYHEATGERLVVTSLTRPASEQPRNSHQLSVHPTGIAVDLRISERGASQRWLESVLLKLERQDLLDVTRERYPPHYHVALFPAAYASHVEGMIGADALAEAMKFEPEPEEAPAEVAPAVSPRVTRQASAAVPAIQRDSIGWQHLAGLAGVLLAGIFFGLGYWRGVCAVNKTEPGDAVLGSRIQTESTVESA